MRIDKWLWAARFFKTRPLAAKNCELGRIEIAAQAAKPAREIKVGDMLRIRTEGGEFEVKVLALSEMRGPASVAQTLYQETPESCERRAFLAQQRRLEPMIDNTQHGRPTKKDRRDLVRLRSR